MKEHRLSLLAVLLVVLSIAGIGSPAPADAAISRDSFEQCLLDKANQARAAAGAGELQMASDVVPGVRDWSEWMRFNDFEHMSASRRQAVLPPTWIAWGENIAMHSNDGLADCSEIHTMWMNSDGHRANILNPRFTFLAVGTYVDGSGWWATQLFFDVPDCVGTFCDDDGSIFESSIERIAQAGITNGCNPPANINFCPGDRVTRGAMAAFLARALELPEVTTIEFNDDDGSVFEGAVEKLATAGITSGCNPPANTSFCPDDYVTRGQMAAFIARALGLEDSGNIDFVDDDGSIFEASIEKLATAGITSGCNPPANTSFCPDDYVTRGQMAAFIARAFGF